MNRREFATSLPGIAGIIAAGQIGASPEQPDNLLVTHGLNHEPVIAGRWLRTFAQITTAARSIQQEVGLAIIEPSHRIYTLPFQWGGEMVVVRHIAKYRDTCPDHKCLCHSVPRSDVVSLVGLTDKSTKIANQPWPTARPCQICNKVQAIYCSFHHACDKYQHGLLYCPECAKNV